MSSAEFESESVRVGRLIERLLVDPVFRAEFRSDPVGVCVGLGLDGLGVELGSGRGLETLELRESRSSLAGVVMAVAAEGVGVAELRGLVGHGLHGEARAAALRALHGGGVKGSGGLRSGGGVGHLERVVERQGRSVGLAGSGGSGAGGGGSVGVSGSGGGGSVGVSGSGGGSGQAPGGGGEGAGVAGGGGGWFAGGGGWWFWVWGFGGGWWFCGWSCAGGWWAWWCGGVVFVVYAGGWWWGVA